MGQFTIACGLSGTPIDKGDRVVALLTIHARQDDVWGLNGHHSLEDLVLPWSLPFRGSYSGFGYPEPDDSYNKQILEHRLGLDDWTYTRGEEGTEIGENVRRQGWKAFWDQMHNDDLVFETEDGIRFGIGLWMAHEPVVEAIVTNETLLETAFESSRALSGNRREFLEAYYQESSLEWGQIGLPSSDHQLLPRALMCGVSMSKTVDERFPIDDLLFYDPPAREIEQGSLGDEELENDIRRLIDQDETFIRHYAGMYAGIERRGDGLPFEERLRYERDKIEFLLIRRVIQELGRNWQIVHALEKWPEEHDYLRRILLQHVVAEAAQTHLTDEDGPSEG